MDRSCLGSCGSAAACQNARKGAAESTPPWLAWLASYTSGGAGKEKMSTAHIRTSSFLVSLLCVSHLIVYLISCACRFSFSPRWAEYQFLSPEINNTHPAEHLLPPPPLSLSSDGAVPIDDSLSLLRQGQSRQSPWHFSKRKADCCCCPTRVRALLQQLTMDRSAH
jgi:hypothetical protein